VAFLNVINKILCDAKVVEFLLLTSLWKSYRLLPVLNLRE